MENRSETIDSIFQNVSDIAVAKAGAIPKFVDLLRSESINVAEQSAWALGSIAGDGAAKRDEALRYNTAEVLLEILTKNQPLSFLRSIVWLMSNLCRNKNPAPPFDKVKLMLPALACFLQHDDSQILTDAAWAISYITDEDGDRIQAVIENGCVQTLVKLLGRMEYSIVVPALRSVGNIVTGSDVQTDAVISAGALQYMHKLLQSSRSNIVEIAAWSIYCITARKPTLIAPVIGEGLFGALCEVLKDHSGQCQALKAAAWVITNVTSNVTETQIPYLIGPVGILKPFCDLMTSQDPHCVLVILSGLKNVLAMAYKTGYWDDFLMQFQRIGGFKKLEQLLYHKNEKVSKQVSTIIDTYFDQTADLAPKDAGKSLEFNTNTATNDGFQF